MHKIVKKAKVNIPRTGRNTASTKSLQSSSLSSARVTCTLATSSTISTSSSAESCETLNQTALSNGSFDKWLILSDEYTRLAAPATSKYSECKLHKWSEKRTRKQIAYCAYYNVCLCIKCDKTFYTVLDLQRVKHDIQNDCEYYVIASKAEEESPFKHVWISTFLADFKTAKLCLKNWNYLFLLTHHIYSSASILFVRLGDRLQIIRYYICRPMLHQTLTQYVWSRAKYILPLTESQILKKKHHQI